MNTCLYFIHATSPLHAGTGQSTAAVDLPIARDRATHLPLIPGSTIKGVLRARARGFNQYISKEWRPVFGPPTAEASEHAGAVAITDARLLLLPVRSVSGTFAWVTSPLLLASVRREAKQAGIQLPKTPHLSRVEDAYICEDSLLKCTFQGKEKKKVVLEELDLNPQPMAGEVAKALGKHLFSEDKEWAEMLSQRLCIVHDDVMSFLASNATEVVTRVHIDPETGVAKGGQLWTEENLPAESILVGLMEELQVGSIAKEERGTLLAKIQSKLLNKPLQIGGKATVGRGRCRLVMVGGAA